MTTITKQEAIDRLIRSMQAATSDDLVEIHNELFPEDPVKEDQVQCKQPAMIGKILAHVRAGLEIEEILDLWNVIFPADREVWFDDVENVIHFDERFEPIGTPQ